LHFIKKKKKIKRNILHLLGGCFLDGVAVTFGDHFYRWPIQKVEIKGIRF